MSLRLPFPNPNSSLLFHHSSYILLTLQQQARRQQQQHKKPTRSKIKELYIMIMESSSLVPEVLKKVAIFVLVQALVYLILSKSSSLFSRNNDRKSHSFTQVRSLSINRILATLGDMPAELSPVSRGPGQFPIQLDQNSKRHHHTS